MRMTLLVLPPQPIGRLLQGTPVLSGECERLIVCSYFVSRWINERTGARHALLRIRTPVETRSAPEPRILGQFGWFQEGFLLCGGKGRAGHAQNPAKPFTRVIGKPAKA